MTLHIYNPEFSLAYAGEKAFMGVHEIQQLMQFIQEGEERALSIMQHQIRCQFEYKDGSWCRGVARLGYNTCERHRRFEKVVSQELSSDWKEGLEEWEIRLVETIVRKA